MVPSPRKPHPAASTASRYDFWVLKHVLVGVLDVQFFRLFGGIVFPDLRAAHDARWQTNWFIVSDQEGVQGPMRQRPDFREAKHAYRRLYKEHVESTGQGNKSIHPAQQRRQNSQQQFDEHEEYACTVHLELDGDIILQQFRLHPRSGSRTMNGSRNKIGIIGDLQPGLNSKNSKVEVISVGKLLASQQEMISDKFFLSCSGSCFSLAGNFQFPSNRPGCEQNTFSHCMHRRRHFVSTSHVMLHGHAWLKLNCVPKTFSYSISCFAPCLTPCTVHPALCPLFHIASTSPSFTGSGSRFDHVQNSLRRFTRP